MAKSKKKPGINRRNFLASANGLMVTMPILPSIMQQALGQQAGRPKRFICIGLPHGIYPEEYFKYLPNDPKFNKNKSSALQFSNKFTDRSNDVFDVSLGDLPNIWSDVLVGNRNNAVGNGFKSLQDKMLLLNGLNRTDDRTDGHNASYMVGWNWRQDKPDTPQSPAIEGESVDQLIAQTIAGAGNLRPSIELQVAENAGALNHFSFKKGSAGMEHPVAESDPHAAFIDLFTESGMSSGSSGAVDPNLTADRAALASGSKTSVDLIYDHYKKLAASPKLSAADKQVLEQHMNFLQENQVRMNQVVNSACNTGLPPAKYKNIEDWNAFGINGDDDDRKGYFKLQFDNIVNTIKCDVSRVVTLSVHQQEAASFLGLSKGYHPELHFRRLKHVTPYRRFIYDHIAYLAEQLNVQDPLDPSRTILDNTVILVAPEMGPWSHHRRGMNALIIGNVNNYFNLGRAVNYYQHDAAFKDLYNGRAHTQLLQTLMDAFGVPQAKRNRFRSESTNNTTYINDAGKALKWLPRHNKEDEMHAVLPWV